VAGMTERKAARRGSGQPAVVVAEPPRRSRRPAVLPTLLVTVACFAVVFEFLALQLQSGRDPALGSPTAASAPAKVRPRKKIIITKVIPAGTGGTTGQTTSSSGGYTAAPAPVVSSTS
jgi:predicted secreted protein